MISKLLKRRSPTPVPATPARPSVPDGTVVWAVGDVHGRMDLLEALVEAIRADAAASDADGKTVIFLGDYVDRGPDSREVVAFLSGLETTPDLAWRFLKGNHEETMLQFLRDPGVGVKWCEYGGEATLRSYGLAPPAIRHRETAWKHVADDLEHRLSPRELAFLRDLEMSIVVGDYFFVHAGVRPGAPLASQSPHDMLWIRRSFLDGDTAFEKLIVHGHTPTRDVFSDHRRIGIDTRAYDSGVLTALRLEGPTRTLIQTGLTDDSPGQAVRVSSAALAS